MPLLSNFSTLLASVVYRPSVIDDKCLELDKREGGILVCNSSPIHYPQSR